MRLDSRKCWLNNFWNFLLEKLQKIYPNFDAKHFVNKNLLICPKNKKKYKCDFVLPFSGINLLLKNLEKNTEDYLKIICNSLQDNKPVLHQNVEFECSIKENYIEINLKRRQLYSHLLNSCLHINEKRESSDSTYLILCHLSTRNKSLDNLRTILNGLYLQGQKSAQGHRCYLALICEEHEDESNQLRKLFYNEDSILTNKHRSSLLSIVGRLKTLIKEKHGEDVEKSNLKLRLQDFIKLPSESQLTGLSKQAFTSTFDCYAEAVTSLACWQLVGELSERSTAVKCVNVCSQKLQVAAKQIEIFVQNFYKETEQAESEVNVHNGSGNPDLTLNRFYQIRCEQIKDSFESKHGDIDDDIEGVIKQMTVASITLELLEPSLNNVFKPSLEATNTKTTFMLYNYARLSMLLQTFNVKVKNGIYPPLPPINEIDFSQLREIEEWNVVKDGLWLLRDNLTGDMKAHMVVNYLHGLSSTMSSFYSRHHIMCGNQKHLLPQMYARIYLVKAVLSAMSNVYSRLNVTPLKQM